MDKLTTYLNSHDLVSTRQGFATNSSSSHSVIRSNNAPHYNQETPGEIQELVLKAIQEFGSGFNPMYSVEECYPSTARGKLQALLTSIGTLAADLDALLVPNSWNARRHDAYQPKMDYKDITLGRGVLGLIDDLIAGAKMTMVDAHSVLIFLLNACGTDQRMHYMFDEFYLENMNDDVANFNIQDRFENFVGIEEEEN